MRISDWSSDVCASDLWLLWAARPTMATAQTIDRPLPQSAKQAGDIDDIIVTAEHRSSSVQDTPIAVSAFEAQKLSNQGIVSVEGLSQVAPSLQIYSEQVNNRSEEHTSELQSLMRISYAVFCLKKKNNKMSFECNRW